MSKRDEDRGGSDEEGSSLAGSQVDADKRRNIVAESKSTHTSISIEGLGRVIGEAYDRGGNRMSGSFDALERHNGRLLDENEKLRRENFDLVTTLRTVAAQNVSLTLLEGQARNEDTRIREMHETLRASVKSLAPGVQPGFTYLLQKFFPTAGAAAANGERSPKGAALRLFAKLRNGSDLSSQMVSVLADFAGEEDWPLVLQWLMEQSEAPAKDAEAVH
jgi:hypothetical protein